MNTITLSLLTAAALTVQATWAACTTALDMGDNSIDNVTMKDLVDERGNLIKSSVVTTDYVKEMLSGKNGFMISEQFSGPGLSWYEAVDYCEGLESPARTKDLESTTPVYTDWRLPSISEMFAFCKRDGVRMEFQQGEHILEPLQDQKNDLNTMVLNPNYIDTEVKYLIGSADFCKEVQYLNPDIIPLERGFGMLVRDIHYTYDGFDSKFFSQDNPRGKLTTNYTLVSSYNPGRSHVLKAPLPISPDINTEATLNAYCVR